MAGDVESGKLFEIVGGGFAKIDLGIVADGVQDFQNADVSSPDAMSRPCVSAGAICFIHQRSTVSRIGGFAVIARFIGCGNGCQSAGADCAGCSSWSYRAPRR